MAFDKKTLLLYAITDRAWLDGRNLEDDVRDVLRGGATFLQLREKNLKGEELRKEAEAVQAVAKEFSVPFVLDDDVMLAKEIGADGVHVGQSDMEYSEARKILGPDKIIGVSCGTVEEAKAAEAVGADYIGVGAVFPTSTKE
ncbi:MAG: thiamine phosphate synthase, partial [Eubacteriales bacterium]|nr:thiamine phosphate synthase [Eubacteriales bacterium]